MKIFYKKSILQQIEEAIHKSRTYNKQIDYIELSKDEIQQYFNETIIGNKIATYLNEFDFERFFEKFKKESETCYMLDAKVKWDKEDG